MTEKSSAIDRRTILQLMATGLGSASVMASAESGATTVGAAGAGAIQADLESFEIHVSDEALEDLRRRLAAIRWPPDSPGEAWSYGTDRAYLQELVAYWQNEYDWRVHEAALNAFDHFTTTIDGQLLHFVHQRGRGPSPFPLLMTHGWPGTVWEMLPSVNALSDPAAHGGDPADAFDVIVPSIPGFGFSGAPSEETDIPRTADLWVALMETLGYGTFAAYGSDWGAAVTRDLGIRYPERLIGIHTPRSPGDLSRDPETAEERAYVERSARWSVDETGYQRIQGTKPQTLAYGLTDSPVGLAAWITEKLRTWSDSGGNVESRFTKDQILTLVSIYWHTNTIGTSVRYYHANGLGSSRGRPRARGPVLVPEGYAEFVANPFRNQIPRSFVAELPDNVAHWSVFDRGGHFPAIEEPELLVGDLRGFFRPLRP